LFTRLIENNGGITEDCSSTLARVSMDPEWGLTSQVVDMQEMYI